MTRTLMAKAQFNHLALLTCLALSTNLTAQTWTLVSSENSIFTSPGLPAGSMPTPLDTGLSDSDGQGARFTLAGNNSALDGHWLSINSVLRPVARKLSPGALGPNGVGAEANHQFFATPQFADAGPNNSVSYMATAGDPSGSAFTTGFWRWQNAQNQELARWDSDGSLGPGIGAGWRFRTSDANNRFLNTGTNGVALAQLVTSPAPENATRSALVMLRPGGNLPCMLERDTGALGPNVGVGSSFIFGLYAAVRHGDQYFVNATSASPLREGIWEVCNGAPRPVAVAGFIGPPLGPNLTLPQVRFNTIRVNPKPHAGSSQVFIAGYFSDTTFSRGGLWRHQNGVNQLLAQTADSGSNLGPNYQGGTFEFFDTLNSDFDSADGHIAFETFARTGTNVQVRGLWRIRPGGSPEPFALESQPGFVSPGLNQTFTSINRWKLFANGDVIAECEVSGGPSGLYLFKVGRAPLLILAAGQTIPLRIGSNIVGALVQSFSPVQGSAGAAASGNGVDSWASTDGGVLVAASISSGGNTSAILMRLQAIDLTRYFSDGFED